MEYMVFYTGLASTPNSVGLKCLTTNEIIHQINVAMPSGKDTRVKYEKFKTLLLNKYKSVLN